MRPRLDGFHRLEVEAADDGAVLGGDFADGAQRDEVTAAGEGFVDLRDFKGVHADRAERGGGVVRQIGAGAEAVQGAGDVFDADVQREAGGRDVVGADEGFLQGDFAVVAFVVVFRRPGGAALFVVERAVVKRGGEGVELRVFDGGEVHHRFDDGADVAL